MTKEFKDDFTGIEAQNDPDVLEETNEFSIETEDFSIDDVMTNLSEEDITEFESSFTKLDYRNMIILPKKPILAFLRMVESWTKVSIDTYGKALRIESISPDLVELTYSNKPTLISVKVPNMSGKIIGKHFLRIEVLKRTAAQSSNQVCLVEEDEGLFIPLSTQLVMVETIKLHDSVFNVEQEGKEVSFGSIDVASFSELIKNFNTISAFSERAQDKTIKFFSDNTAHVVSPAIRLLANSPFNLNTINFEIPKTFIESLQIIVNSTLGVDYKITEVKERFYLSVSVGAHVYILSQISPSQANSNGAQSRENTFTTDWDAIKQLSRIVSSFDYYNPVIGLAYRDNEIIAETKTKDLTHTSHLNFPASSGVRNSLDLKFNAKIITNILSQDVVVEQASFTEKSIIFYTQNSEITVSSNF
jgi:hypothetical protein